MRARPFAIVLAAVLLAGCGGAGSVDDGDVAGAPGTETGGGSAPSTGDPDAPVTGTPTTDDPMDDAEPELVEPRSGMEDVRPRPFDEAEAIDDSTVEVRFWSGVEPCYVLDSVEVEETDETVTITLFEGSEPTDEDVACIEIAVWKATHVELSEPLGDRDIVDGAEQR
jgi:hypothetical protein